MYTPSELKQHFRSRGEFYGVISELLSFPTKELGEAISHGALARSLRSVANSLPYEIDVASPGFSDHIDPSDLEADYIRLFDLPGEGKPCPLYTGVYAASRRDAMEELLRFYRHFGVTLNSLQHDLPDAVPTVIEFQQYLVLREGAVDGDSAQQTRVAQVDLLGRHLRPWAVATRSRLGTRSPGAFYEAVVSLANSAFAADAAYLETAVVSAPA